MIEEKYRPIVSFRATPEEWEQLRGASARAGRDESVGLFTKRTALREAGRAHKRRGNGNEPLAHLGGDSEQAIL